MNDTLIKCIKCGRGWTYDGSNFFNCPACQCSFFVDEFGEPMRSSILINCPKCKETWDAEIPGEVKCPSCKFSFFANEDGVPEEEEGIVTCPDCGVSWYGEPPGEYECDCGCLFDADEFGVATVKRNVETVPNGQQSLIKQVLDDMRHKLLDLTLRYDAFSGHQC
jgi:predicted Zn finger-like uncharacterized protein